MRAPRPRLTYANVASSLALFVALGGTSYAVTKLPKNSVGTPQLKSGAVTLDKLATGVAISGPRGPRGSEGPQGQQGPTGPSEVINVHRPNNVVMPSTAGGGVELASATLPAGNWSLDASANLQYLAETTQAEYFTCALSSPAVNGNVTAVTVMLGSDPSGGKPAPQVAAFPLTAAFTLTSPSTVTLRCAHPSAIPNTINAFDANLRATRVGSIDQR